MKEFTPTRKNHDCDENNMMKYTLGILIPANSNPDFQGIVKKFAFQRNYNIFHRHVQNPTLAISTLICPHVRTTGENNTTPLHYT